MGEIAKINLEMVSLREASARTGISYDRLRKMCIAGEVAHFRTGKKWLIDFGDLCKVIREYGREQG